ncbi:MAG: DUF4012 domain-containing protein [Patescibacteria group bacterium]
MKNGFFTKGRIIAIVLVVLILAGAGIFFYAKGHKTQFAAGGLNLFQKVSKLLPISQDTKKEIAVIDNLVSELTAKNDRTWTFLVMLQNNYELRPGGGFLGQYAIIKVKNGEVISSFVEDANLLDQRINAKIAPPYPLTRKMQLKKWKFRDSNFSPDFPTNAAKAEYFYKLSGGREQFDAVIAVNADVFDHVLALTGPITPAGYSTTFTSEGGALKLEEAVEKAYLGENVSAEAKQNRKAIMKKLAAEIIPRIATVSNAPKVAELTLNELREKNVMMHFKDEKLQSMIESVHWDGSVVTENWDGDYLMLVDANLGALKTDYYIKRSIDYTVDFTGEKPIATVVQTYKNTAPYGDWRTSDYHTYLRAFVPKGSKYLERFMINAVLTNEEFNKTYFGGFVDVEIGQSDVHTTLKYELPDTIKAENYKLLIQKQSGVGTIPVNVHIKTKTGDFNQEFELKKDLNLSFQTVDEKK